MPLLPLFPGASGTAFAAGVREDEKTGIAKRRLAIDQAQLDFNVRAEVSKRIDAQLAKSSTAMDNIINAAIQSKTAHPEFDAITPATNALHKIALTLPVPQMSDLLQQKLTRLNMQMQGVLSPQEKARQAASAKVAGANTVATETGASPREAYLGAGILKPDENKGAFGAPFGGQSLDAQSTNALLALGPKIRDNTATPQERAIYSAAYNRVTAPRVVGSPESGMSLVQQTLDSRYFPAPTGTAPSPGTQGGEGTTTTRVGEQLRTPERAGRTEMIQQQAQVINGLKNQIVQRDADGKIHVNRTLLGEMVTSIPLMGKGIPYTEGRTLRAQFEDAASAKLRLETGAQANESEIQNIVDRFMPSMFDSDQTVADKLDRMTTFFNESLKLTDPKLYEQLTDRSTTRTPPAPPADEPGAKFEGWQGDMAVFQRPNGSRFGIK